MNVGAIIIGDEILSGKRVDRHFDAIVGLLAARGLRLTWAEYLGDERARIASAVIASLDGEPDADVDAAWAAEIERRVADVASGTANYAALDVTRIRGLHSDRINEVLGYDYGEEVVHRNNLVLV